MGNRRATDKTKPGRQGRSVFGRCFRWAVLGTATFYISLSVCVFLLRWIDPFTTGIQIERRVQALFSGKPYQKVYTVVPISQISPSLQHAVVAAEDSRFFQHHGFDWTEVQNAIEEKMDGGRSRGASTITQQVTKNLFLTTSRSILRKAIEASMVPVMELVLPKKRILELYLNVVEWGPGIYGAEAAARRYYRIPAKKLNREQSIELASVLPAPLRRRPGNVSQYAAAISTRMAQMGW